MEKFLSMLSIILAVSSICFTSAKADEVMKIQIEGTLVKDAEPVKGYTVKAVTIGANSTVLEEIRTKDDGRFQLVIFTDKSYRLVIMDKKGNVVSSRVLPATEEMKEIDFKQFDVSPKAEK